MSTLSKLVLLISEAQVEEIFALRAFLEQDEAGPLSFLVETLIYVYGKVRNSVLGGVCAHNGPLMSILWLKSAVLEDFGFSQRLMSNIAGLSAVCVGSVPWEGSWG